MGWIQVALLCEAQKSSIHKALKVKIPSIGIQKSVSIPRPTLSFQCCMQESERGSGIYCHMIKYKMMSASDLESAACFSVIVQIP